MKIDHTDFRNLFAAAALTLLPAAALAGDGVEIMHLSPDNTLVRVEKDARLVLLPVQESNPDARIDIIVDGKADRTINVRLATAKTDYTVPLDLSPYKGKDVVLDILTPQGRSSVREAKDDICWTEMRTADEFNPADTETKYRPLFHHTPLYGWMNDPNGMFYKDGVWNLYYQYNPYGSKWQNMTWGHATSKDLIHWEQQPLAILPDGFGMIFSGSCALDPQNTAGFGSDAVVALYTSANRNQIQSMAHSNDGGMTFEKLPANPVITLDSEARDPNMFRNPETQEWNLVLAHALEHEMLFFTSPDLKTWTLASSFGKGLGAQDGVWECPDLFKLPVDGNRDNQKWVLLVNLNPGGPFGGSAAQYFIGDWDGHTFTADKDAKGNVPTKWLDYGKDNYATVTFSDAPDNRRTALGWMSNWQYAADVPTMQYRSANTLPRELKLFTGADGDILLASEPSPELLSLRGKTVAKCGKSSLSKKGKTFRLPTENSGVCEILAELDGSNGNPVELTLSNAVGNKVTMVYDPKEHTVSMDRTRSGVTDFSDNFPAVTVAPTFEKSGRLSLRIFVDRSSIELFADGGRAVMTNLVFPEQPYTMLTVSAPKGKAALKDLKIFSLK